MNQADFVDFFLQMQADYDLPDEKIHNPYFQTGWQNALLPYEKMDCLRALQEYAESPIGINPPRIARIVAILKRNAERKAGICQTPDGAWAQIIKTCGRGVLWASDEKKQKILSELNPKICRALEMMDGLPDDTEKDKKAAGAYRSLVRIASTDYSVLDSVKAEFTKALKSLESTESRYLPALPAKEEKMAAIGENPKPAALPDKKTPVSPGTEKEEREQISKGTPKYILDIIEARKRQYRSENTKL